MAFFLKIVEIHDKMLTVRGPKLYSHSYQWDDLNVFHLVFFTNFLHVECNLRRIRIKILLQSFEMGFLYHKFSVNIKESLEIVQFFNIFYLGFLGSG